MKVRITKLKNGSFVFHKETTLQSVISDGMTLLVLLILIGVDILCCIYVQHLLIIDILVLAGIFLYLDTSRDKSDISKEEFLKEIND